MFVYVYVLYIRTRQEHVLICLFVYLHTRYLFIYLCLLVRLFSLCFLFCRAVDPRILKERLREREAKAAIKENKVRNSCLVVTDIYVNYTREARPGSLLTYILLQHLAGIIYR